jgi:hypothetical protein
MGLIECGSGEAMEPPLRAQRTRSRPSSVISELETDLGQLYLRMMDEPIPGRLLEILRGALAVPKP